MPTVWTVGWAHSDAAAGKWSCPNHPPGHPSVDGCCGAWAFRERDGDDPVPAGVSEAMGRSLKTRVIVGFAAVALLASVLVGVAAHFTADAGTLTTASIMWCRNCGY